MKKKELSKNGSIENHFKCYQGNPLVEGIYQISLNAKKLMLCAISQITPDDEDFRYYMIEIADFKKLAGITGKKDYFKVLKTAVRELRANDVDIYDSFNNTRINVPFAVTAIEKYSENAVGFSFPPELKPYLLKLKESGRFTKFELGNVMKMRSVYSIRLYELLKQYENVAAKERTFELDDLKSKVGVPKGKLKTYQTFKVKVLETAKKEIPEKTDIGFSYVPIKQGRAVKWIQFNIKPRKRVFVSNGKGEEMDTADLEMPDIPPEIINLLPEKFKNHRQVLKDIAEKLNEKGEAYVFQNVAYVTSKNPSKNFIRYLNLALKNNWGADVNPFQKNLFPPQKIAIKAGQRFEFDGNKVEVTKNDKGELGFYFNGRKGPSFVEVSWLEGWVNEGKATLLS